MPEKLTHIGAASAIALGLYLSSLYSYLLFHSLIEIVTIAIALALFILTWNTRAYSENSCLRLLGIGYAFSALIDLVHTLAYKGMNVFPDYGANLPTQLWIAARYLQTVTLVAAPLVLGRRLHDGVVVAAFAAAAAVLVATVFSGRFPACYIEGTGLTDFKIGSEYLISALLLASLYLFFRKRNHFDDRVFVLVALSIGCTAFSEMSFTAYASVYGAANLVGHFLKLAAFYFIYRAILVTGLKQPFDLVFRDLKQAESGLRKAQNTLEERVRERTTELQRLNRELRAISNCNQILVRAEDEQTLLNAICRTICDEAGYRMAWVGYAEHDDARTVRPAAWAGFDSGYIADAKLTWSVESERGSGPAGKVIRSGEPICVKDFATDPQVALWRDSALQRGYRSCIALPLKDEGANTFGILSIYSTEANAFTSDEIRLLEELAGDLAFGITVLRVRERRKQAERELTLVNFAMNHVREAAFLVDKDARFHYVNDDACQVLEYSREELLGLSVADVDPDFPPERWQEHWHALQTREDSPRFEGRHRTKSGRIFPVEIAANYFEYEGQGYNLALVRDITERKRAEDALVLVAQRGWQTGAESFFDVLAQFLCEKLDMDYAIIDRIDENPEMAETVAMYANGAITPNMRYALKGTPCENVMGQRLCVYRHGVQQLFPEDTLLRELGVDSYIGIPLWDSTGRSIGLIAVMGNKPIIDDAPVTQLLQLVATRAAAELERERSDRLLRAREHEFRTLAENLPDNIVRYDREGRTIYVNPVLEKTLGADAARMLGTRIRELNPDGSYEAYAQAVDTALASGENGEIEITLPVPNEEPIVHQIRIIVERDDHGEVAGVLAIGRDITERKQAEQERLAHLRFFESMDRINRAIQETDDLEKMMGDVLDGVLTIFDCDRAFLIYPCDPEAASWSVPMERTKPEYPGANVRGLELPMDPESRIVFRTTRTADGAVSFGPGAEYPLPEWLREQFGVQSQLTLAIRPKVGKPYMFGMHQCSCQRIWTSEEEKQLREIGRRLADGLTSLLSYRDLRDSESRLEEAQRIAHIGHWLRDFDAGRVTLSVEACRIVGLPPQDTAWDLDAWQERWLQLIHPEDRQGVARAYADALESGSRYDAQYRVVRPDGGVRIVHSFGDIRTDESGRPRRMFGAMQDITEPKRAELQLRASEQAFRAVVENTPDVIVRYDREGRRIFVNPAFERVNHISAREVLGKKPVELSTGLAPMAAEFTQKLMAAMDSGSVAAIELSWTAEGNPRWWFVRVVPEFDAAGTVVSALTIWSDITERKRAEAQLKLAASVFEHAHEGVTITDADANIVAVNRRFTEVTGYSTEEVIGRNPRILKSGRHDAAFYRAMWASIDADGFWTGEIWNKRKDGSVYPEWLSISSVRDDRGKVANYVALFADVSERVAAETALRESEQHLRFALGAARMLAWERDLQLDTTTWGEHPEWALGPEPAGGYPDVVEMVHPEDREAFVAAARDAMERGAPYSVEFRLVRTDGEVIWVRLQGMPFSPDPARQPDRIIGVSQDITERKRIEGELLKLNEDLERRVAERTQALELANRELEAFSYSVSHDLRAPLRAIRGFSQILQEDNADRLDENVQGLLARIDAGAEKMAHLIDDLLKLSQISRQAMHVGPVDLSALAREVVEELQAEESGRRTTWVIAPQVAATGDPGLLRVVLYNLLDNARKYSSKREGARVEFGLAEKGGRPAYFVRDNGAGFDMARAGKLFGPFQRLHTPAEFPGSGIGLATVARIVRRHGGEVWAESTPGEGASFFFTL